MRNNINILLIEDDKSIRESLTWALDLYGYTIETAINGLDALKKLKITNKYSLIFLDLVMPVMDGFAFREIQKADPEIYNIPTIIMSAGEGQDSIKLFPNEKFLPKPFNAIDLISVIKTYCD